MVRKMEPSSLQSDMLYILSYFTYDLYMFSEYFIFTLECFQLYYKSRYSLEESDDYGIFGDFLRIVTFHLAELILEGSIDQLFTIIINRLRSMSIY